MSKTNGRGGLLKEPLVHFLLIGLVVFGAHSGWTRYQAGAERTIVVRADEVQRLAGVWAAEAGRDPAPSDVQGLLADYVREEVLYREALRLGLDRDDTIIRRRLAQKMGFVVTRDEAGPPLSEIELRVAFEANKDAYARPARLSFVHVPFNFTPDGATREDEANAALAKLQSGDSQTDWRKLGDAFLLSRSHVDLTETELTRLFGRQFAGALFALEQGNWVGPLRSRLAMHLVRIEGRKAGGIPAFEEIVDTVRVRETELRIRAANEAAMRALQERYTIVIDGEPS